MNRARIGNWLLGIGALVTVAGSLLIEVAVLLLLSPISVDRLMVAVQIGIGAVTVGIVMLFLGKQLRRARP